MILLPILVACAAVSGCAGLSVSRVCPVGLAPREAAEVLARGEAFVVDLRSESDFRRGHIPGAFSIPARRLGESREVLPQDAEAPILVYDDNGAVSDDAALWLVEQGYNAVSALTGGLEAWRKARLPLEGAAERPGSL